MSWDDVPVEFGDGISAGSGRIRREIHWDKVASLLLVPRSDSSVSGSVPLEFDEEVERFDDIFAVGFLEA